MGRGFHVRNAVVLVRATVAEAFRDAKRGGGLKSPLTCLPVEGLGGIAFVLSPNARKVVTIPLERKPSGTAKSVCMSYMLGGKDRVDVDRRIGKVSSCLARLKAGSTVVSGGEGGISRDDQPQT